jgi:uncharacterized protein YicC (UPF0701 family)
MTGFGRASFEVGELAFDVEVRSVNHRYLDARVKLPRLLAGFEGDVRARLQARLDRGKVDLSVTTPGSGGPAPPLEIDLDAARKYLRASRALCEGEGVGEVGVEALGLLGARAHRVEVPASAAEDSARRDAAPTPPTRCAPRGRRTERDRAAPGPVEELVSRSSRRRTRRRRPRTPAPAREQLRQEIRPDEARLTDRAGGRPPRHHREPCVRSHVDHFRRILGEAGPGKPVGRQLDFLLQEFGREANTIGSKAADASVAHWIVELKTEIERLREQVQNIE